MDGVDNESRISRLESEIRYLKGLLDENGIAYDYETYVESGRRRKDIIRNVTISGNMECVPKRVERK